MFALGIQQTSKVCVQPLVPCNKLVRGGETWQQPPLLEPEDRTECPTEEHTLYYGKGHQARGKIRLLALDPGTSPVRLALDARHRLDGPQNIQLLHAILDVGIDEERIGH